MEPLVLLRAALAIGIPAGVLSWLTFQTEDIVPYERKRLSWWHACTMIVSSLVLVCCLLAALVALVWWLWPF